MKRGSPRRNNKSSNYDFPSASRHTISPSSTAGWDFSSVGSVAFNARKRFELVTIAGNQSAPAIVGVDKTPKTIPLDVEETVRMAERSGFGTERHSLEMREGSEISIPNWLVDQETARSIHKVWREKGFKLRRPMSSSTG
jgi:hypothetical protein